MSGFFTDSKESESDCGGIRLAKQLRRLLVAKGIPVNDNTTRSWSQPMKVLAGDRGEALVSSILDWYAPRCQEPFLPRVRSPRTLIDKFERLLYFSGLEHSDVVPSAGVKRLLTNRRLHWPFDTQSPLTEPHWLEVAVQGISADLKQLPRRKADAMGPPLHVAGQWRLLVNARSFKVRPEGFHQVGYHKGDDFNLAIIMKDIR